ncbi:hypothetical protein C9374_005794 [Naegleria lovaniensis]|uniref:Solute carrier family 40 member n=1 Tax=Naegleria lovaniensis TaxID=51637 RepID=A0AA88GPB1_NAELO|nr:uncharacterized protein C9374_005794 [Naegleria lovaniensis]KAG2382002.1 hypothetical protein C9374_005794 [Naegleria lovaniensis]
MFQEHSPTNFPPLSSNPPPPSDDHSSDGQRYQYDLDHNNLNQNDEKIPSSESAVMIEIQEEHPMIEENNTHHPLNSSQDVLELNHAPNRPFVEEHIHYAPENVQVFSLNEAVIDEQKQDDSAMEGKTQLDEMLEFQKEAEKELTTSEKIKKYFKEEFDFKSRKLVYFYISHFLASWGDRMWAFALPVIFGDMFTGTLLPMALFGFIHRLTCVIFGPNMGYIVDTKPRFKVMTSALIIQNSCVAITTVMIFLLAVYGLTDEQKKETPNQNDDENKALFVWPFKTTLSIILFISCTLIGAVSELAAMVTSVARTKDWCVVIARSETLSLEKINSMMRRLDMVSLIVSPVFFGLIVTFAGYKVGAIIVCAWNVISLLPEYFCIYKVYNETTDLHISKYEQEQKFKAERERELESAQNTEEMEQIDLEQKKEEPPTVNLKHQNIFKVLYKGWKLYIQQKVLLSSLAFVLLFITVLTHGGLLLSYLKSHNIHSAVLGVFQALSAISGLSSTFLGPFLIRRYKVFKGGLISIYLQFWCLVVGVAFFIGFHFFTEKLSFAVYLFLICVVFSRLGLYSFDLAEIQIMQQLVDQADSGIINATEGSLTKVADLVVFIAALLFSTPSNFVILVIGSLCCVGSACLLYSLWYLRHKKHFPQWLQEIEDEERMRSQK